MRSIPSLDENLAYLHDGSIEGFFSAIFKAYEIRQFPSSIAAEDCFQQSLGQICVPVETIEAHATRVQKGLVSKIGEQGFTKIARAFVSPDSNKDTLLYRYILYVMQVGRKALGDIAHEDVSPVEDLANNVMREHRYMLMFTRFSLVDAGDGSGVYFAKINPASNIVPFIMDHFVSRFNVQPFIIYDEIHHIAGVYDTKRWYLADAQELNLPDMVGRELDYQHLWQTFFDIVAIKERKNYVCQRNFMPKRFWRNLTEMQLLKERDSETKTLEEKTKADHKRLGC